MDNGSDAADRERARKMIEWIIYTALDASYMILLIGTYRNPPGPVTSSPRKARPSSSQRSNVLFLEIEIDDEEMRLDSAMLLSWYS